MWRSADGIWGTASDPIGTLAAWVRGVRYLTCTTALGTLSMQGQKSGGPVPIQNSARRKPIGSTPTLAVLNFGGHGRGGREARRTTQADGHG